MSGKMSLFDRVSASMETLIMTRLVPRDNPGPVFRRLFKIPLLFYRLGLPPSGRYFLLLTTTGRKSGRLRRTPLEYHNEEGSSCPVIMAGWGGNTDWCKNIRANPLVQVQIGRRSFAARAEALTDAEVAAWLAVVLKINPNSAGMWSRWAGEPVSADNPAGLLRAAHSFPSFRLIALQGEGLH